MIPHMTSEIPAWIQEIQPKVIKVPLFPYSTSGELFSSEGEMERFFSESWKKWTEVPDQYDTPPHVFVMDFAQIRALKARNANLSFAFVLANFIGRIRPAYVAFDNLSSEGKSNPWESLNLTVGRLREGRGVAVARRQGEASYQLVGTHQATEGRHWQHIFTRLAAERDWVRGQDFVTKSLDLPIRYGKQAEYLHLMAKEGLVLQKNAGALSYYRSLV